MPPKVSILILNWNNASETIACVESLRQQDYGNFEIVIVDNGSDREDFQRLARLGGEATIVRSDINLGFAGGCNFGIRRGIAGGAEYVWLLNNDARVASETLARLVAVAEEHPGVGLVTPIIKDTMPPYVPEPFCGIFDAANLTYQYTNDISQARAWTENPSGHLVLMGTALLLRRSVFETIGGLDERFFAYWEDTDYSIRASKAGFVNRIACDAYVLHPAKRIYTDGHEIAPHYPYYMARNEILLLRKHGKGTQTYRALWWRLRQQIKVIAGLRGEDLAVQAILLGLWDGVRGKGGTYVPGRRMPWPITRCCRLLAPFLPL